MFRHDAREDRLPLAEGFGDQQLYLPAGGIDRQSGPESGVVERHDDLLAAFYDRCQPEFLCRNVQPRACEYVGREPYHRSRHVGQFGGIPQILAPAPAPAQIDELYVAHDLQRIVVIPGLHGGIGRVALQIEGPALRPPVVDAVSPADIPYFVGVVVGGLGERQLELGDDRCAGHRHRHDVAPAAVTACPPSCPVKSRSSRRPEPSFSQP